MGQKSRLKRERREANPPWTPFEPAVFPGQPRKAGEEVWKNSRYTVIVKKEAHPSDPEMPRRLYLSIKRNDKEVIRDWRDLQRIKNELLGPEQEMVELFPAESRLVDTANQYHLWGLEGVPFAVFGFNDGRLVAEGSVGGAKQRPFEADTRPADTLTAEEMEAKVAEYTKQQKEAGMLL